MVMGHWSVHPICGVQFLLQTAIPFSAKLVRDCKGSLSPGFSCMWTLVLYSCTLFVWYYLCRLNDSVKLASRPITSAMLCYVMLCYCFSGQLVRIVFATFSTLSCLSNSWASCYPVAIIFGMSNKSLHIT